MAVGENLANGAVPVTPVDPVITISFMPD